MSYLYADNVSPRDRFELLELQLDNGSAAVIQRGRSYDLSSSEAARASHFVVLVQTPTADSVPVEIARLPVAGVPHDGDVPIWSSALAAFVPSSLASSGGGGLGSIDALTVDQRKYFAMSLVPLNRGVDPAYATMFGDLASGVSTYGAPSTDKFRWPDGGFGKFTALTIVGGGGANPSTVEEYEVTYRHYVSTKATDRSAWIAVNPAFVPMGDGDAAALVTRTPETWSQNVSRNVYVPSDAELAAFHAARPSLAVDPAENPYTQYVTGRPGLLNPTTDELIQWTSHKWGIPTDRVRAQMHMESKWSMDMLGDRTTQVDSSHYNAAPAYARVPATLDVYESLGISQLRWHPDAPGILNPHPGTDPLRWKSTAFNLDYYGCVVRFFFDDPGGRRTAWGDGSYASGNEWLSQGGWFEPYPWGNSGQTGYVTSVQARLADVPWMLADFTNVSSLVKTYHQPLVTRNVSGFIGFRPDIVEEDWVAPTPPTAAPTNVVAVGGDTTITVTWDVVSAANNGGSAIIGYLLTETDEGWQADHTFTNGTFTFTGLPNGTPHRFTVAAYNAVGVGPASASSNSATPSPPTVPGAPTGLTGTPHNASVALSWTAPANNGGSAITNYRIIPKIAGVSQTPVDTPTAATTFSVTGLTNGTAYTFVVRAINAVGASADSSAAGPYTPSGGSFTVPPQMPTFSTGLPTAASDISYAPANAVDSQLITTWRSITPPTTGAPGWLAVNINSIASGVKTSVWCLLRGYGTPRFVPTGPLGSDTGSPYISLARNYKLRAHASSSSTCPVVGDAGWVDLVTVTDNRRVERIHTGLNLSTYGWFQVYVTEASGYTGANDDVRFQLELRDVSAGVGDSIMIYGDSITMEANSIGEPDGDAWFDEGIAGGVATATGRARPLIVDYSTGGWTTVEGDANKATYVGGQPPKIWVIAFGHNDAHGAGGDLNSLTPSGVNSTYAQAYKTRYQSLIDYAVAQGASRVIVPYITYTTNGSYDEPNTVILNSIIDQLVDENVNVVQLGPDLHTFFQTNPTMLRDGIHPTYSTPPTVNGKDGYENYHQIWTDWLVTNVYT